METENGNVVKNYSYYYDTTHKDRLSYINEELDRETKVNISYEDSFYKPSSIINEGITYNLTWRGRDLIQIGDNKYTYNSQGLRIKKEVEGVITNYIYQGDKLIALLREENEETIKLEFNYDNQNNLIGISNEGKEYIYIRDILGNINGIIDQEGKVIVYYKYDAWGNLLKETIVEENPVSTYNPFIYKGYMYDRETGWFWLSSRYYSPELCRWISPDSIEYLDPESINGLNLYAYCGNDPVNRFDPSGHAWEWSNFWQAAGYLVTGIGAIVAGALVIASGIAAWPMLLVAGITIGAGVLTTINGVAEVGDLAFGYNFMEDGLFGGNSAAYNTYATITGTIATIGAIVCGGWRIANNGKIQAFKSGKQFLGKGYKKVGPNRYVSQDGMRQMRLDFGKYNHGAQNHVNLQSYMYPGLKGELLNAHVYVDWWRITKTVVTGILA